MLEMVGLAKVKRLAPVPRLGSPVQTADLRTLLAVIENRHEVLANYPAAGGPAMRVELVSLWARSMATREQLLARLQDWCRRAEASGIGPLVAFSQRLRCYT
jgi:hypothetical protein